MTSQPSKNTKFSIIGLVVLGAVAITAIAYNIDKWFAGGIAVKRIAQTCDVLGSGCSSALATILQIMGGPQVLLLNLAIVTLILAAIKAFAIVITARRVVLRYNYPLEMVPRVAEALKDLGASDIKVRVSDGSAISAFTYGIFRPVMCISKGLVEKISDNELKALLAHEIGHIRQRDNLAIFLALFVRDFLWLLPISHHLFSIFIHEKEYAADDFAVKVTGKPLDLASAIISVAKLSHGVKAFSPAYATFFSTQATVKTRVSRLVGSANRRAPSVLRLLLSTALSVIIALAVVGFAYAQPSVIDSGGKCAMGTNCAKLNYKCCNHR